MNYLNCKISRVLLLIFGTQTCSKYKNARPGSEMKSLQKLALVLSAYKCIFVKENSGKTLFKLCSFFFPHNHDCAPFCKRGCLESWSAIRRYLDSKFAKFLISMFIHRNLVTARHREKLGGLEPPKKVPMIEVFGITVVVLATEKIL